MFCKHLNDKFAKTKGFVIIAYPKIKSNKKVELVLK